MLLGQRAHRVQQARKDRKEPLDLLALLVRQVLKVQQVLTPLLLLGQQLNVQPARQQDQFDITRLKIDLKDITAVLG